MEKLRNCPKCRASNVFWLSNGVWKCKLCGYEEKHKEIKQTKLADFEKRERKVSFFSRMLGRQMSKDRGTRIPNTYFTLVE